MVADEIPAYTYGMAAAAPSTVSLDELEKLKVAVGFTSEDERFLRMAGEVLAPIRRSGLLSTGAAGSSPASLISHDTRVPLRET